MVLKANADGDTADITRSWNRVDNVHLGRHPCYGPQWAARRYPEPQYRQRKRYEARLWMLTPGLGLSVGTEDGSTGPWI